MDPLRIQLIDNIIARYDEPSTLLDRVFRALADMEENRPIRFPIMETEYTDLLETLYDKDEFSAHFRLIHFLQHYQENTVFPWMKDDIRKESSGYQESKNVKENETITKPVVEELVQEVPQTVQEVPQIVQEVPQTVQEVPQTVQEIVVQEIVQETTETSISSTSSPMVDETMTCMGGEKAPEKMESVTKVPEQELVEIKEFIINKTDFELICDRLKEKNGKDFIQSTKNRMKTLFIKFYDKDGKMDLNKVPDAFMKKYSITEKSLPHLQNMIKCILTVYGCLLSEGASQGNLYSLPFDSNIYNSILTKMHADSKTLYLDINRLKSNENLIDIEPLTAEEYSLLRPFGSFVKEVQKYNATCNIFDCEEEELETFIRSSLYTLDYPRSNDYRFIKIGSDYEELCKNDCYFHDSRIHFPNNEVLLVDPFINDAIKRFKTSPNSTYLFELNPNTCLSENEWENECVLDFDQIFSEKVTPKMVQAMYLKHRKANGDLSTLRDHIHCAEKMGTSLVSITNLLKKPATDSTSLSKRERSEENSDSSLAKKRKSSVASSVYQSSEDNDVQEEDGKQELIKVIIE